MKFAALFTLILFYLFQGCGTAESQTSSTRFGSWVYKINRDLMTDSIVSEVASTDGVDRSGGASALHVYCSDKGGFEVRIDPFAYVPDQTQARIRFDHGDPRPAGTWTLGIWAAIGKSYLFMPPEEVAAFLVRARSGSRVVFRFEDSAAKNAQDFVFSLNGFTAATKRLHCRRVDSESTE